MKIQDPLNRRGAESGLSMLEVLIAMTVAGMVMAAGATLLQAGLGPILGSGIRAREAVQIHHAHRMMTRDLNAPNLENVAWELRPDPTGLGYELVRSEYRDGQWSGRVMLDGVAEVDPSTGWLRMGSGAERWVEIIARPLSEP
jgi:prepilin-type N-terminal cleavage/methylation domain-containing protein